MYQATWFTHFKPGSPGDLTVTTTPSAAPCTVPARPSANHAGISINTLRVIMMPFALKCASHVKNISNQTRLTLLLRRTGINSKKFCNNQLTKLFHQNLSATEIYFLGWPQTCHGSSGGGTDCMSNSKRPVVPSWELSGEKFAEKSALPAETLHETSTSTKSLVTSIPIPIPNPFGNVLHYRERTTRLCHRWKPRQATRL